MSGQVAAVLPIERLLQHMAQQGEHPHEHRAVPQGWQPPVHPARRGRHRGQLDRGINRVGGGEPLPLQPGQVGPQGHRISVALPMKPPQHGPGPIRQVALGQRRHDRLQLGGGDGIGGGQVRIAAQQAQQVEQAFEIQQAGVAMALHLPLPVGGRADALVEPGQLLGQHRLQELVVGGHQGHHGGEALGPAGADMRIGQGRRQFLDHRLGHQALAVLVPLQAGGQGGEQPPADPLHRRRQRQRLGEGQPPGPPGMGGIDDHRTAVGHGRPDPLVQQLLDRAPRPLHRHIAEHLGADHIGGEHHRLRFTGGGEQGRQGPGQGGLATGRRADQEVAAQSVLRHWISPERLARKGGQLRIGGEQYQPLQLGLGRQHPIKGVAVGLAVAASPQTMGQRDRQGVEAIGLEQARKIIYG